MTVRPPARADTLGGVNLRGAAYASLAAMLYGSSYVATAIALRSFTPLSVAAWRGLLGAALLAALLLLPAMAIARPGRPGGPALLRLAILGVTGGAVFIVAMNAAVALAGATVTAFVAGLYAVLAALFAIPMLGERIERRTLVALLVALAGTALLAELRVSGDAVRGIGIALIAAVSFGLFLVLSRRWSTPYDLSGPVIGVATLGLSAVIAFAAMALIGEPPLPADPGADALLALAWLAAGPGAAAAVLVVAGMRQLEARHASVFLLLNPPTAAILSFALLGERLSGVQLVGGTCVLVAIAAASGLIRSGRAQAKGGPT